MREESEEIQHKSQHLHNKTKTKTKKDDYQRDIKDPFRLLTVSS